MVMELLRRQSMDDFSFLHLAMPSRVQMRWESSKVQGLMILYSQETVKGQELSLPVQLSSVS